MAYKPNVPQATDFISQSQRDFQNNFQAVEQYWGLFGDGDSQNIGDHVPLNDPTVENIGKHRQLTLQEQNPIPSPGANEADLYSAETSSRSELFYRRNGDATGNQITANGGLSVGGLVLRAYVLFDFDVVPGTSNANIITTRRELDDGTIQDVPISYNIASVVANQPLASNRNTRCDWNITYSNALPTEDYIWVLQSFNEGAGDRDVRTPVYVQPRNNVLPAGYNSIVSTTGFAIRGMPMIASTLGANYNVKRVLFQAYTVG